MVGTIEEIIQYLFKQDKTKQYEIKEYREKRSKDANSYCWVLCDKIAQEMSRLIELLVQEAKELGIETKTQAEINSLLESWNKI